MKGEKWLLSFFLFLFAAILTLNIIAILTCFIADVYLYFFRDVPFEVNFIELMKITKGASLGGIIVGVGCWYASFKNER